MDVYFCEAFLEYQNETDFHEIVAYKISKKGVRQGLLKKKLNEKNKMITLLKHSIESIFLSVTKCGVKVSNSSICGKRRNSIYGSNEDCKKTQGRYRVSS